MTDRNDDIKIAPTDAMAEAAAALLAAATRMGSAALAGIVPGRVAAIRQAIDDDRAAITVQCDLPSGAIRVLIDGEHWPCPQCLLAIDPTPHGAKVETKRDA